MSHHLPDTSELVETLNRYGVVLDENFHPALVRYCTLLWKWNSRLNLTRHTDYDAFVTRDLIDTLRLSQHLPASEESPLTLLDVGSGGGVPGIPLAITRPELHITLAESVRKKANALSTIVRKMKLEVDVHAGRAEELLKKHSFDVLTVRAVASLRKLLFWFQQNKGDFERMLLIKGPRYSAEVEEAAEAGLLDDVHLELVDSYPTPGHDNESVILSLRFDTPASAEA